MTGKGSHEIVDILVAAAITGPLLGPKQLERIGSIIQDIRTPLRILMRYLILHHVEGRLEAILQPIQTRLLSWRVFYLLL
jgi:hypothetical protein